MARAGLNQKAMRIIFMSMGVMIAGILCGCPGANQSTRLSRPITIVTETSFVHTETEVVFAPAIDGFDRVEILQYDQEGRDVSASYVFTAGHDIVATVYIYPAPKLVSIGSPANVVAGARWHLMQGEFQGVKHDIMRAHPNAVLKSEEMAYLEFNGERLPGLVARYEYEELLLGAISPLTSDAYLFPWGKWLLKFRATYRQSSLNRVQPIIQSFMDAIEPSN